MSFSLQTVLGATASVLTVSSLQTPPNIVYFLVDDLGYANVGFHNDEPITPNIDELHASGIELMSLYAYKFCSPTRSSIMSGRLPLHVNQQNHPPGYPGGGVPLNMTTIANKLQSRGYATHQIGKWHCGMSGTDRLPVRRGFNTSLGYLSGAEDHFLQTRDGYVDFWESNGPAAALNGTSYSTFIYTKEMLRIIRSHDTVNPMFMYMAFQNTHGPLQVPDNYTAMYKNINYNPRLMCLGMISAVDEAIGRAVNAIKERSMYDNTLFIYSSDNGGPHDHANNEPFRGSKGADFEGGTRVVAFVSGGVIPTTKRGQKRTGLMHVCDWYATLGHLAGYEPSDPKAAAAGLPPPDSIDAWSWIVGEAKSSPRSEVPLSGGPISGSGLIKIINGTTWKLVRGTQGTSMFPGLHMPNSSNDGSNSQIDCGEGQLYQLDDDPIEHINLATDPAHATVLQAMQKRAADLDGTYFQSDGRDAEDPAAGKAAAARGGYWGPWLPPGPVPAAPTPPPPNPNPPVTGAFLKFGSKCLGVQSLVQGAVAQVGACDSTSKWENNSQTGALRNVNMSGKGKDAQSKSYLRHEPPAGNCAIGTPLQLGEQTAAVYSVFANGKIISKSCDGMCAVVGDSSLVQLGKCSDASANGWIMTSE